MKAVNKCILYNLFLGFVLNVECIWYLENPNEHQVTNEAAPGQVISEKPFQNSNEIQEGVIENKTFLGGVHAEADSTFKGIGSGGARKYDASNALTRGGGYWCSEHDLMNDRIVKWTATLKSSLVLRGLKILWQYAPEFVSIWVAMDDDKKFFQVLPFMSCENVGEEQELIFPRKTRAKYVEIRMRGQVNGYFGITFVQFIGEENPTFRIQSGITSVEDMCLQVDTTGEVVLESCITSISKFQFNDIWRYNKKRQIYNPLTKLCLTLEDNVETEGGTIKMLPCKNEKGEDYNDGRNSWTFTANNQLRMRRPGNLCLSQKGSSAGMANVALNKIAKSNFSILNKEENSAEKALDGNAKTYWISRKFKSEEGKVVEFTVDLQEKYKLQTLKIEWYYPALSYNIYTKNEGDWEMAKTVGANTLKSTIDYLNDREAQYIKIELKTPNPEYSDGEGNVQYGISSIAAYTNRLKTIVESCEIAKGSKDARDKYFLESVYELDFRKLPPVRKGEQRIEEIVKTIENKLSEIERLNAKISKCKNRHESYFNKVEQLKKIYKSSLEKLSQVGKWTDLRNLHTSTTEPSTEERRVFSDCIEIKKLGENKPSGFYNITPVCKKRQIRVYCDMYTGSSYYVTTIEEGNLIGLSNVIDECSKYGLQPLQLQHENQIKSLEIMLKTMEVPAGSLFPVAVKVGGALMSLDLAKNVSKYVNLESIEKGNILGITPEGVDFFDGRDKDMSGVICKKINLNRKIGSTNYSSVRLPEEVPKVSCGTRIADDENLPKAPGSKFNIKCPQNCHETNDNYEVEGGKDGLYSFNSSLCLAAIHAGEYDDRSSLEVEIVSSPEELDGFYQNGINSASVSTTLGDLAFKIKMVESKCKFKRGKKVVRDFKRNRKLLQENRNQVERVRIADDKEKGKENTKKEKEESTGEDNEDKDKKEKKTTQVIEKKEKEEDEEEIDSYWSWDNNLEKLEPIVEERPKSKKFGKMMPDQMSTGQAIHSLISHIYAQNTKGSPIFLDLFKDHTGLILANTRDLIKKADLKKLPGQSMFVNLDHRVDNMGTSIQLIASQISYKRQMMIQKMEKLMKEKMLHASFESFSLLKMGQEGLFSNFLVETSNGTKGYATWVMSELNVKNSTELTVSQMSQIIPPNNTVAGTYLILKDRKFFDFIFSASVYPGSAGSVGLAFRVVDMNNYYLLQMKQTNGGFKRLIRVIDGEPYELARVEDGGYIEQVWYHVRIETRQSRLIISVVQGEDEIFDTPKAVIDVIDATHSSGTVGLYTGKVAYAHFKRFNVEALSCLRYDAPPLPPEPPFCSIFREDFLSNFSNNWSVYNLKGEWRFDKKLMGEENVVVNTCQMGVQEEADPTIAVLRNHKSCTYGTFTSSVLSQCDFGTVGLVFRFHNPGEYLALEISPKYAAVKQMYKGISETLSETNLKGIQLNVWTTFAVNFNDDLISVSMGTNGGEMDPVFLNVKANKEVRQGGSVGLSSMNCTGVAFSNISLKPIYKRKLFASNEEKTVTEEEDVNAPKCMSVDRRKECEKMSSENLQTCEANFCSFCCQVNYNDKESQSVCEDKCSKQDEKVSLVEKYLDQLWFNCSSQDFIERAQCQDHECKENICGMCCESSVPQENMSKELNSIAKAKCKKMCSVI